jgi:hypothetical protein
MYAAFSTSPGGGAKGKGWAELPRLTDAVDDIRLQRLKDRRQLAEAGERSRSRRPSPKWHDI